MRRRFDKSEVKVYGLTVELLLILSDLDVVEVCGMWHVAVKCICHRTPIAKAAYRAMIDAEARKRGERTGLDTLVVHALNDAHWTYV